MKLTESAANIPFVADFLHFGNKTAIMIVDSMTRDEVYQELERDLGNFQRWVEHRMDECRRYALKQDRKRFPLFLTDKYISPRKIKYWLAVIPRKRDDRELLNFAFTIRHTQQGREVYVCRIHEDSNIAKSVYTPHAIKRYAERSCNNHTGDNLIMIMFARSYNCAMSRNQLIGAKSVRYKGDMLISLCTRDGAFLGKKEGDIYIMYTFITYDMMGGLQKEILQPNLEIIKRGITAVDKEILKFNNRKSLRTNQPITKRTNDKTRSNLSVE